jgi:translation initiation factor IF-2
MENYLNKPIKSATAGSPVRIIGWSELPLVGGECFMFKNKKEAEAFIENEKSNEVKAKANTSPESVDQEIAIVPILIKADTSGSLEALKYEIGKLKIERVNLKIIGAGLGDIQENDIKMAAGKIGTLIIGFNVKTEGSAKTIAEKLTVEIHTFEIIYKMTEWLEELAMTRTPRMEVEEQKGQMKVLKIFSVTKDKYVLGCRCESGVVNVDDQFKLMRRGSEISRGRIRELQQQKSKVGEVTSGECGLMAECKMEIAPGDYLEVVHKVIK